MPCARRDVATHGSSAFGQLLLGTTEAPNHTSHARVHVPMDAVGIRDRRVRSRRWHCSSTVNNAPGCSGWESSRFDRRLAPASTTSSTVRRDRVGRTRRGRPRCRRSPARRRRRHFARRDRARPATGRAHRPGSPAPAAIAKLLVPIAGAPASSATRADTRSHTLTSRSGSSRCRLELARTWTVVAYGHDRLRWSSRPPRGGVGGRRVVVLPRRASAARRHPSVGSPAAGGSRGISRSGVAGKPAWVAQRRPFRHEAEEVGHRPRVQVGLGRAGRLVDLGEPISTPPALAYREPSSFPRGTLVHPGSTGRRESLRKRSLSVRFYHEVRLLAPGRWPARSPSRRS